MTPGLPSLAPSHGPSGEVFDSESWKHDLTSLESPLDPLPGFTTSSRSPSRLASIRTTWVTLPNQPQELPGRVDPEIPYPGDGSRRIAPDERHDPTHSSPVAAPRSLPESPNQIVTFVESEPQGGSTNGIMWESLR